MNTRVTFRHPLVRSAICGAATPEERRDVHRALAAATDPALDPDRPAWHLAQAASHPDDDVAAELERSGGRAQGRGGFAAAAAFLERSAELTVDPLSRASRARVAAEAKRQAGALDDALVLAAIAERGPLDESQRAQLAVLRARVSFGSDVEVMRQMFIDGAITMPMPMATMMSGPSRPAAYAVCGSNGAPVRPR